MKSSPFKNSLSSALTAPTGGSEKGPSRLPTFRPNSVADAVQRKLVESLVPSRVRREGLSATPPAQYMGLVANKTASNINDAENMMQLLPDLSLAMQVLISSILSPADMMSCALTWSLTTDELGELGVALLEEVKDFFENSHNIKAELEPWLKDILFMKGSKTISILPESVIDDAINSNSRVSLENLRDEFSEDGIPVSLGVLGNPGTPAIPKRRRGFNLGMESLDFTAREYKPICKAGSGDLLVTDNPSVLKWPILHEKMVLQRAAEAYSSRNRGLGGVGMESVAPGLKDNTNLIYRPRGFNYMPILTLKSIAEVEKATVGHPLKLDLPPESVIPVHVPGAPDNHIGYFVIADRHGNPISQTATKDYYSQLSTNTANFREMSSQLLAQTRRASEGQNMENEITEEQAVQMYTDIVEKDLYQRLSNGIYGENVKISRPEDIYRIMFARACERMMTQLIFIPTTNFIYMAFEYNDYGVGKSLLEDTKIIGSLRAMLLFANTMAAIKNSVSHVKLNIKLDPEDPDPDRTVETLMHEFAKTRQAAYPIGAANPLDIVNFLQQAGVQILVSGHEGYMQTEVDLEQSQANYTKIDTELDDMLKKRQMMALNVAPETVEMSMNVDFATSVISSNILLAKRGMMYQQKFTPFVEDYVRKYTVNSGILMERLMKIIREKKSTLSDASSRGLDESKIFGFFINSIKLELPVPDFSRMEMQGKELEQYIQMLDQTLPAFVSADIFDTSALGEAGNNINSVVAIIKARYLRRFMQKRNIMPELFELTTFSEDDGPAYEIMDEQLQYVKGIGKSLKGFLIPAAKLALKNDEAIQKARGDNSDAFASNASAPDSGGGSTDDSGGGDDFGDGFDDLGGLDGTSDNPAGDETPPEGETPEGDGETKPEGEEEPKKEGEDKTE